MSTIHAQLYKLFTEVLHYGNYCSKVISLSVVLLQSFIFSVSIFLSPLKELNLTCCEATEANWAALDANELQPYKQQQCSWEGFVKYKYYESNK